MSGAKTPGPPTRVYITVDVEGAEERTVNGRLLPPQGYDLRVWCRFKNQRRGLGIGLIMRELEAHGLRGTFFVEVFGSNFFGKEGLEDACDALQARGHDVQLHTHPVQRNAAYRSRGHRPDADDIADYDVDTQANLLREGVDILTSCGVPRADIVGFRAGNFGASNETWEAMKLAGLTLSSNYNPDYFAKRCRMRHPGARPALFEAIPGVWELPVSNFTEGKGAYRHVQITAVSAEETLDYLRQARALGLAEVCIVTHSFEFCHIDSVFDKVGRGNTVNVSRLRALARFLAEHPDEFQVDTVGALGRRLASGAEKPVNLGPSEMPHGRFRLKARRLVEQTYKRLEAKLPISIPVSLP